MGLYDITFYDIINRNAQCFKDRPAWYDADDQRSLTFAQYKQRVDALAYGLRQTSLQQGDRIGVLGKNSLEFFLLYGAAAALGLIVLPINWRLSPEEIVFNLNDGQPTAVFVDEEFQQLIIDRKTALASVDHCFNLKADAGNFDGFASLLNKTGQYEPADVSADSGLVIIHTAAVAGRPRGALLSHVNMLTCNLHLNYLFGLTQEDIHLNLLPLCHVAGLTMAFNAFHAGALNVNMSKFDAAQAVDLIADKNVTVLYEFMPILARILDEQEKTGRDISSLQSILGLDTGETIERYQNLTAGTFFCVYGQTETTGLATLGKYNDRPGAAGKIIPLADVRLLNDNGEILPSGETGEIVMRGPLVFKGYWNLPEDNRQNFRGGWHHTGDLGRFDADGFLWYEGRKADKELIKPGGENVYPAEVEKAILEHPAVMHTVVFGVPDPKWKEGIKAVCQLAPDQALDAKALIRFVGERIAGYKKPQYVEFVDNIPLLADGSPDRMRVKKEFGAA